MKLISFHIISYYKNLKDFKLTFDSESFIDVFVGINGSGKSNFFEALLEVYRHLYEHGSYNISFDYSITYKINDETLTVSWENDNLRINNKIRKTIGKTLLPDNILIYYSGHNTKVHELLKEYEESFKKSIKGADIKDSRRFIGIGKEYRKLLLVLILLQSNSNIARGFIITKLGIKSIGNELRISLKRPFYAKLKGFEVDRLDRTTAFWRPKGITKDFLDIFLTINPSETDGRIRDEGYIPQEDYFDKYQFYFNVIDFKAKFSTYTLQDLFRAFDNLKTIEMLDDVSIEIELENGMIATTDFFSDGQFQAVYMYTIIELFKGKNCLTLLDEPDSFLHPEWQFEFLKNVFEISEKSIVNNHILLSSHSAVTLIPHKNKNIKFFDIKANSINCYNLSKTTAIKKLSSNLIKYSEQEQLLSIINTIQIENKPVLFTEGSTDPIIIKEAWYKLYDYEIPFIPFYAFSSNYLYQLLNDEKIIKEMNGLPLFGLFDFDKAYNQWNGLRGDVLENDPNKGLIKQRKNEKQKLNIYAIMLPIPNNPDIRSQVIKSEPYETFCDNSQCEIEHLFYGSEKTKEYFNKEPTIGRGQKVVFKEDSKKVSFAKNVIPNVETKYFEVFRPMFDFIKNICKK